VSAHAKKLKARLTNVANVYNAKIERLGRVAAAGHVYDLHEALVGVVAPDGHVSIWTGQVVGVADAAGRCADVQGHVVGMVHPGTGGVFDRGGRYQGYVAEGEVCLQMMAGSALLLLLGPRIPPRAS
jgi:hypothetical protein